MKRHSRQNPSNQRHNNLPLIERLPPLAENIYIFRKNKKAPSMKKRNASYTEIARKRKKKEEKTARLARGENGLHRGGRFNQQSALCGGAHLIGWQLKCQVKVITCGRGKV